MKRLFIYKIRFSIHPKTSFQTVCSCACHGQAPLDFFDSARIIIPFSLVLKPISSPFAKSDLPKWAWVCSFCLFLLLPNTTGCITLCFFCLYFHKIWCECEIQMNLREIFSLTLPSFLFSDQIIRTDNCYPTSSERTNILFWPDWKQVSQLTCECREFWRNFQSRPMTMFFRYLGQPASCYPVGVTWI